MSFLSGKTPLRGSAEKRPGSRLHRMSEAPTSSIPSNPSAPGLNRPSLFVPYKNTKPGGGRWQMTSALRRNEGCVHFEVARTLCSCSTPGSFLSSPKKSMLLDGGTRLAKWRLPCSHPRKAQPLPGIHTFTILLENKTNGQGRERLLVFILLCAVYVCTCVCSASV